MSENEQQPTVTTREELLQRHKKGIQGFNSNNNWIEKASYQENPKKRS